MILSLAWPGLAGLSESQEKYDRTIVALCVNTQYSIVRQFEFNELRGLFLLWRFHHSDAVVPTDWQRIHHCPAMTAKQMEVFTSFSNCSFATTSLLQNSYQHRFAKMKFAMY